MKELIDRRTKTMKVFEKAPNERLYRCHVGNIHYPDSSKIWQDIDTTLMLKAGGLYCDKNACQLEIPDKADGLFSFFNQDHFFDVRLVGVSSIGYEVIDPETVRYKDIFGQGIHFEVRSTRIGLTKRIVFEQPPPNPNKDFEIEFELISLPNIVEVEDPPGSGNWTIIDISQITSVSITGKNIRFHSPTGSAFTYIAKACCINSDPEPNPGRIQQPKLTFYRSDGKTYLKKTIPKQIFKGSFYPIWADDPATYTTGNGDGFVESSAYGAWDTVHDAITGFAATGDYDIEAFCYWNGSLWKVGRAGCPIDTSGIPDGDTITAVDFHVYGTFEEGNQLSTGPVGESAGGLTDPLAAEDFNDIGDAVDNPTEFATRKAKNGWDNAGWNIFSYNANGIASIDKTGTTWACLRMGADCDDIEPNPKASQRVKFENSEANGNDAYLDVTSSAVGAVPTGVLYGPLVGPMGGPI